MKMKCPICNGTGIQEETMKGYRRYKCWSCEGKKEINNILVPQKKESSSDEDTQTQTIK